jgi:hypothetical protein
VDAWTLSVLLSLGGATGAVVLTGALVARAERPTSRRQKAA